LVAEGSGEFKGMKFAFIPDANEMRLAEEPAGSPKKPSKVDQNKREQFVITTPGSHQMPVIPALNQNIGINNPPFFHLTSPPQVLFPCLLKF